VRATFSLPTNARWQDPSIRFDTRFRGFKRLGVALHAELALLQKQAVTRVVSAQLKALHLHGVSP